MSKDHHMSKDHQLYGPGEPNNMWHDTTKNMLHVTYPMVIDGQSSTLDFNY